MSTNTEEHRAHVKVRAASGIHGALLVALAGSVGPVRVAAHVSARIRDWTSPLEGRSRSWDWFLIWAKAPPYLVATVLSVLPRPHVYSDLVPCDFQVHEPILLNQRCVK